MTFYRDRICPCLTHLAMRAERLNPYRARVLSMARGRVLEIGIGSGLNLEHYGDKVTAICGLAPSAAMLRRARMRQSRREVTLLEAAAEAIPTPDASFDSVVSTWTLCSVSSVEGALAEIRRVLRPGGVFVYVEHGRSPEGGVAYWQDRLNPFWRTLSGGCNMNRPIAAAVRAARFDVQWREEAYAEGPRVLAYFYQGRATSLPSPTLSARDSAERAPRTE